MFSAVKLDICYTMIYQVHIMEYVPYVGWGTSNCATMMTRFMFVLKKKKKGRHSVNLWKLNNKDQLGNFSLSKCRYVDELIILYFSKKYVWAYLF
jgi:hypothetical protein